jgi:hypothetical protein
MSEEEGQRGRDEAQGQAGEEDLSQEDERLIRWKQKLAQAFPPIEELRALSDEDIVEVTIRARVSQSQLLRDADPQEIRRDPTYNVNRDAWDLFCWFDADFNDMNTTCLTVHDV